MQCRRILMLTIALCSERGSYYHGFIFMTLHPDLAITFSPLHRLQWEEAQQKYIILYPEGMVELNQSSAEILKCCNGERNLQQIIEELETKFATSGLANDIAAFLQIALENSWIQQQVK